LEHNASRDEVEADRRAARQRFDRWKAKQRGSNAVDNGVADTLRNGVATDPSVSRSVSRSVSHEGESSNGHHPHGFDDESEIREVEL
jgi:hypothetical protein